MLLVLCPCCTFNGCVPCAPGPIAGRACTLLLYSVLYLSAWCLVTPPVALQGRWNEAKEHYQALVSGSLGVAPNTDTINTIMVAFIHQDDPQGAINAYRYLHPVVLCMHVT